MRGSKCMIKVEAGKGNFIWVDGVITKKFHDDPFLYEIRADDHLYFCKAEEVFVPMTEVIASVKNFIESV